MTPWLGVIALMVALATAALMRKVLRFPAARGHNPALDGLRGYLAFGVFLHHAVCWYVYVHEGVWRLPPLRSYRDLGLDCVNFFFMITGYLFVGKILNAKSRPIDWVHLYTSRVLRIVPLYLLAMLTLFALALSGAGWRLQEPASRLVANMGSWLSFGVAGGMPAIDGYPMTGMLIAFVVWTLAYEWLFYFSLPLVALLFWQKVPKVLVAGSLVLVVSMALNIPQIFFPVSFVAGAVTAAMVRLPRLLHWLNSPAAAVAALFALGLLVSGLPSHQVSMALIFGAFCVVASGNGLFNVLSNRAAVELGEVSYGIYLLHALVLSAVILFVLGPGEVRQLTGVQYWLLVTGVGSVVVCVSTLTFRYLERPLIRRTGAIASRLRALLGSPGRRPDPEPPLP